MNKDQVKGAAKDFGGKVQETVGKWTGKPGQQVKGLKKQLAGKTQQQVGNLEEAAKKPR